MKNITKLNIKNNLLPISNKLVSYSSEVFGSEFTVLMDFSFLTLYILMDSSVWFDTINFRWSIIYIEGSQVIISNKIVLFSLQIIFVIAISVDPNEMQHNAVFHLVAKIPV